MVGLSSQKVPKMQQSHYGVGDNLLGQMAGDAQTLYRMRWVHLIPWRLLIRSF
jgi:hypothetical protein